MKRTLALLFTLTLMLGTAFGQMATPSLSVSDQMSNDFAVTIEEAVLAEDGFIVVHAVNPDGSLVLTPELGKLYLEAGTHTDVSVPLDPDQLIANEYEVGTARAVAPMLHIDDGDQQYEFPGGPDTPVSVDDSVVVTTLSYTQGPALHTFAQTLANGTIRVDAVAAAQDGFVVVHALDRNGDAVISPPLGLAQVEAGFTRFLSVELDADLLAEYGYDEGPKAIVPMLHIDDGNGTYEFPDGPDTPVVVDGGALVSPLELSMPMSGMAAIEVGSGTLMVSADGLSITLDSVTLVQEGFVVLHAANEDGSLKVLPVLGVSPLLSAGTHENVTIPMAEGQTPVVGDQVFAMAHVDDGDGSYVFPESDPPYIVDGGAFVVPFTLN